MSSLITFIRSLFSEKSKTSTKDNFVVENTSDEEMIAILPSYTHSNIIDITHPLNPIHIKCNSSFGIAMMYHTC